MNVDVLGIDLAKRVFESWDIDERGQVVLSQRVKRKKLRSEVAQLPKCQVNNKGWTISALVWPRRAADV